MQQKHIIIILAVVVVALVAVMAVMSMPSLNSKNDSKIAIVSNSTLYGGDNLTVKLTDLNNAAISAGVKITVTDNSGNVVLEDSLKTDSDGKVSMSLNLDAGNYTVNATFSGNDNFTANSTTQKLVIEKEAVQETTSSQSSQSSSSSSGGSGLHYDAEVNVYYNDEGVIVDPDGQHGQGVGSSYADVRDARDRWERGEPVMV